MKLTAAPLTALLILTLTAAGARSTAAGNAPPPPTATPTRDPLGLLLEEIDALAAEVLALRSELAQATLETARSRSELLQLQRFIEDHHELGTAFAEYRAIKEITQRETQLRLADAIRQRRESRRAERARRTEEARVQRAGKDAEAQRLARYRRAGLSAVGLDVYVGRTSFFYRTLNRTVYDIEYDPLLGIRYLEPFYRSDIDFSSMTISGTVVNGSDRLRNIGVAITFFDERGTQVGGEIIKINNARPDVPYPFTTTLRMALNRPYSSSSSYVLYADQVVQDERPPTPPPDERP